MSPDRPDLFAQLSKHHDSEVKGLVVLILLLHFPTLWVVLVIWLFPRVGGCGWRGAGGMYCYIDGLGNSWVIIV